MTPRASTKLTTTRGLTTWWGLMGGARISSTVVPVRQINKAMQVMKKIMDLEYLVE